jgi:hypothetical protein
MHWTRDLARYIREDWTKPGTGVSLATCGTCAFVSGPRLFDFIAISRIAFPCSVSFRFVLRIIFWKHVVFHFAKHFYVKFSASTFSCMRPLPKVHQMNAKCRRLSVRLYIHPRVSSANYSIEFCSGLYTQPVKSVKWTNVTKVSPDLRDFSHSSLKYIQTVSIQNCLSTLTRHDSELMGLSFQSLY